MELHLLIGLGVEPGGVARWLPFVLTYLAHSLLWAAAAALLVHRKATSSSTRHLYWKLALFGPLLSALLATALPGGLEHSLTRVPYVREVSFPALTAVAGVAEPAAGGSAGVAASAWHARAQLLAGCAIGASFLGLLRFAGSALLLARRLRGRQQVSATRLLTPLARMRKRIGLRSIILTESPHVGSPLVIGATEICIPLGLFEKFSDAEVETVFAHELAHVERGDGIWFPLVGLMQSVLWLHPLNHWLSARFRHSAELACDDRAVELTRDPLGLARALVQVAASASFGRRLALLPTMARSRSGLFPRVERLTCAAVSAQRHASRHRGWAIATLSALGILLASVSIQVAQARPPERAIRVVTHASRPARDARGVTPPNAAEQSARMADLARREQELTALLDAAQRPDAAHEGSANSVRTLELSQELRHVRATQSWLENRFVEEWAAWEKTQVGSRRAAR